jgi:hypothetical protein
MRSLSCRAPQGALRPPLFRWYVGPNLTSCIYSVHPHGTWHLYIFSPLQIKFVPELRSALRCERVWISWGTAPRIPHVTLHERLYFRENGLLVCPLERTLRELHNRSVCGMLRLWESSLVSGSLSRYKYFPFLTEIKPWFVCRPLESFLRSNYLPTALYCNAVGVCLPVSSRVRPWCPAADVSSLL